MLRFASFAASSVSAAVVIPPGTLMRQRMPPRPLVTQPPTEPAQTDLDSLDPLLVQHFGDSGPHSRAPGQPLGSGSWGSVWEVSRGGKLFAKKKLSFRHVSPDPNIQEHALQATLKTNTLVRTRLPPIHSTTHKPLRHVVPLLSIGTVSDTATGHRTLEVLMPRASGDLEHALSATRLPPGAPVPATGIPALNPRTAQKWLAQLRVGLRQMHEVDLAHLDLKPDNLLLFSSEKNGVPDLRIADYDLVEDLSRVKNAGAAAMRLNGKLTLPYRSPQVIADQVDFGFRGNQEGLIAFNARSGSSVMRNADWWAALCVFYEVLAATLTRFLDAPKAGTLQPWKLVSSFAMHDKTANKLVDPLELGVKNEQAMAHFSGQMPYLGEDIEKKIEELELAWGRAIADTWFLDAEALIVGRGIEVLKSGFSNVIGESKRVKAAILAGTPDFFNIDKMGVNEEAMWNAWTMFDQNLVLEEESHAAIVERGLKIEVPDSRDTSMIGNDVNMSGVGVTNEVSNGKKASAASSGESESSTRAGSLTRSDEFSIDGESESKFDFSRVHLLATEAEQAAKSIGARCADMQRFSEPQNALLRRSERNFREIKALDLGIAERERAETNALNRRLDALLSCLERNDPKARDEYLKRNPVATTVQGTTVRQHKVTRSHSIAGHVRLSPRNNNNNTRLPRSPRFTSLSPAAVGVNRPLLSGKTGSYQPAKSYQPARNDSYLPAKTASYQPPMRRAPSLVFAQRSPAVAFAQRSPAGVPQTARGVAGRAGLPGEGLRRQVSGLRPMPRTNAFVEIGALKRET